MARQTWEQKFFSTRPPHVAVLARPFAGVPAGGRLFIASPPMLDEWIRALPPGSRLDPVAMRAALAETHRADGTCPTSTAIFLRILAERALELLARGEPATPFWRVIPPESPLARRLSCGPEFIRQRRAAEGA